MAEEIKDKATNFKKIIWLIIIILLLLIITAAVYLFLTYYKGIPRQINSNQNTNQIVAPQPAPVPPSSFNKPNAGVLTDLQALNPNQETISADSQNNLLFAATSFAERFGSYSNQSDYKNFAELDVFMTNTLSKWVNTTYIPQLKKKNSDTNIYYAIETKAISTQIQKMDETTGKSDVLIKTQRQEFNKTITNPRVFYQNILLNLIKQDNQWKVDGVYWQ